MANKTIIYIIIAVLFYVSCMVLEEYRISKKDNEILQLNHTNSILKGNNEILTKELSNQSNQIQDLQKLIEDNKKQFEDFKNAEQERLEVLEKVESVDIDTGSEDKIGVISKESSNDVKDLLNKNFSKFNKGSK